MFQNKTGSKAVWFFYSKTKFFNVSYNGSSSAQPTIRKLWETNGNSLRIAPDILGQWNND